MAEVTLSDFIEDRGGQVDRDQILNIYDPWYAETYDERFHGGDPWNDNLGAYKIEVVRELLDEGDRWLDVGCGTGKHLSALPDVEREGLDLSPSMVEKARESNPGVTIHNGSYLDDHPEWVDRWDLVTNLWLSYQFVDSLKQLEAAVANMASWVALDGRFFMHIADCEDVARGTLLPWEDPETPVFGDSLFVTSVTWTWKESNGRTHHDLVAPQLQRMVNIVARHFEEIEIRRWPAIDLTSGRPKGLIGRKKREQPLTASEVGDVYPFTTTYPPRDHPREQDPTRPGDPQEPAAEEQPASDVADQLSELRHEVDQVRGDISTLAHALLPPVADDQDEEEPYDTLGVVHEQVWELRKELDHLRSTLAPPPPPTAPTAVPTKHLAAELARRSNPLRPSFWRRLRKRAR